jgi:hypothetical protein
MNATISELAWWLLRGRRPRGARELLGKAISQFQRDRVYQNRKKRERKKNT